MHLAAIALFGLMYFLVSSGEQTKLNNGKIVFEACCVCGGGGKHVTRTPSQVPTMFPSSSNMPTDLPSVNPSLSFSPSEYPSNGPSLSKANKQSISIKFTFRKTIQEPKCINVAY